MMDDGVMMAYGVMMADGEMMAGGMVMADGTMMGWWRAKHARRAYGFIGNSALFILTQQ